jgi:hypothetical protein
MSEVLTVKASVEDKAVIIQGTKHPLALLHGLLGELLFDPECKTIRAVNPESNIEIRIELL